MVNKGSYMRIYKLFLIPAAAVLCSVLPALAASSSELVEFTSRQGGFSFQYPEYWTVVTDPDTMISIQDGSIDLIRQENFTESERASYMAMVHVDGSPRYLSNVVFMARPHRGYQTAEQAVQAVKNDFERTMASGTYFLEETYLGESHTYVYRKSVSVPGWRDTVRITYYVAASTSKAYMMVESVLSSVLEDPVYRDQFNQVVQSFRITANETTPIDPGLDWGAAKPGGGAPFGGEVNLETGQVEIHEDFDNNRFGWPTGPNASVSGGRYVLDSQGGYPFTVRNTGLGQIAFDFCYEGKVEFLSGNESAGYGLVFGYLDENNYFAFLVTRGGQFMVFQEKDGRVNELVPWTATSYLEGRSHTLLVQGDYQTLREGGVTHRYVLAFYIDGKEVARSNVSNVLSVSGWYGLFVSEGVRVAFDSLVTRNFLLGGVMTLERIVD